MNEMGALSNGFRVRWYHVFILPGGVYTESKIWRPQSKFNTHYRATEKMLL